MERRFIETALLTRPTVASKFLELELIIKNGAVGFLCDDEREWETTFSKLIENKDLRNKIGKMPGKRF